MVLGRKLNAFFCGKVPPPELQIMTVVGLGLSNTAPISRKRSFVLKYS